MQNKPKFLSILLIFCLVTSAFLVISIPKVKADTYQTPAMVANLYGSGGTSSASFFLITLSATPSSGILLMLDFYGVHGGISSITETGVTWTKQVSAGAGLYYSEIWVGVVGAGASTSINVSCTATQSWGCAANVYGFSGLLTVGFLDKTASQTSAFSTGLTATTTQTEELVVGTLGAWTWVGSACYLTLNTTVPSGWTLYNGTEQYGCPVGFLTYVASATGTFNASATCNVGTTSSSGCVATFKAASASDTTAPTYSTPATNTTVASAVCNFTVNLADETALANYTFGTNNTGTWVNASVVNVSGTSYLANSTLTLNSTIGYVVQWEVQFADSSNNLNNTGLQTFTVTATSAWTKTYLGGNTQATLSTWIGVSTNSINPFGTP